MQCLIISPCLRYYMDQLTLSSPKKLVSYTTLHCLYNLALDLEFLRYMLLYSHISSIAAELFAAVCISYCKSNLDPASLSPLLFWGRKGLRLDNKAPNITRAHLTPSSLLFHLSPARQEVNHLQTLVTSLRAFGFSISFLNTANNILPEKVLCRCQFVLFLVVFMKECLHGVCG